MNAPASISAPQRAKLSARDFWLLADAGAFSGYKMTELIEGEIWFLSAVHQWHARTILRLGQLLLSALRDAGSQLEVFSPVSVDLTDDSVPEPDLSIGVYKGDGPLPREDLRLVVEIADASIEYDVGRKTRLYGAAGVPEYWIVAREGSRIIQQWAPTAEGYAQRREVPIGGRVRSETLPGLAIETGSLL